MSPSVYTGLGWRWLRLGSGLALHLCPPRPGPLSRAACGRPIEAAAEPLNLTKTSPRCMRCLRRDRGRG